MVFCRHSSGRILQIDEAILALRAVTEHREDLARTRTINRLHALMPRLVPAALPRRLTADSAAAALRRVRPATALTRTLHTPATDLVAEIRRLDRRITAAGEQICAALAESGTTLPRLHGIGDLLAAKIIARTGKAERFRSAAAFTSCCGVAPRRHPPARSGGIGSPALMVGG